MDVTGLSALLEPDGWALLQSLPPYDAVDPMVLSERLRGQGHDPGLVAAALTQSRLRAAAVAKFGPFAAELIYTADGLEQATRLPVAARHARRFVEAAVASVADLGCGIGADSLAMAGLGLRVEAVDLDPVTAAVATVNLRHVGGDVTVRHADATDFPDGFSAVDAAWADPGRRAAGRRINDPQRWLPPLSWATSLASTGVKAVGVKVAPGLDHGLVDHEAGWQAEWTSVDGDVVEGVLWWGTAAVPGVRRSAVVLGTTGMAGAAGPAAAVASGGADVVELARVDDTDAPPAADVGIGEVGAVLYEPDGAVIRAGLVTAVAVAVGGRLIDPTIAYITAEAGAMTTPLAKAYSVEAVLPWGLKRLRAYLVSHGVGSVVVKRRGSPIEPEELRRALRLSGPRSATVILTRSGTRRIAIVCQPVPR